MRCPSCQVPLADPAPAQCPFCKTSVGAPAAATTVPASVQEALARGNKIEAIKALRDHDRSLSLLAAKQAVEALAEGRPVVLSAPSPGRAAPAATGSMLPWMLVVAIASFAAGLAVGMHLGH